MLKAFTATQRGNGHVFNEDAAAMLPDRYYIVADGVGKSPYPYLASEETVRVYSEYFSQRVIEPTEEELALFSQQAGRRVREASNRSSATVASVWLGPAVGTTVPFFGFTLGDSRLYLVDTYASPVVRQLSRDHIIWKFSWGNWFPWTWRWKKLLSATCGGNDLPDVRQGIVRGELRRGQWLILATDGAWPYWEENHDWLLWSVPRLRHRPQQILNFLVRDAARQTKDDSTIILIMNED